MNWKESFIKKANERHNNAYDYSKVEYINATTKVCIICPKHGEFWMTPQNHLKRKGCPKCSHEKSKKSAEQFINDARKVHGDKYDYSKVEYVDAHTKICIICPEHGEFWQTPNSHLNGCGCSICSHRSYVYTRDEWITNAKMIHGDKYDYSKVEYINNHTKVCIICPEHGEFWMTANRHLQGQNCPKCAHRSYSYTTEEFIEKARKVHGDKYDYSKVEYINNHTKICIICPEHGEFWQTPSNHLNGAGCERCGKISMSEKAKKDKEKFIQESKSFFGDWFDYSKVNYINNKTKVCLICRKHGEFYTRPDGHLTNHRGCPQCASEKNVHETILFEHLKKRYKNINFFHSKRGIKNLGLFEIDIFDEENKVAIEYQGDEHFEAIDFFNGDIGLNDTLERDKRKIQLCEKNGIKLFHFTYNKKYKNDRISYKVYTDEEELYNELDNIYNKKL
jgi:hypothetical protein